MQKQNIFGQNLLDIEKFVASVGHKPNLVIDIGPWLYKRGCRSFLDMISIPLDLRKQLAQRYTICISTPVTSQTSTDGTTRYLMRTMAGNDKISK